MFKGKNKETHTDEKNHKCDVCSKLFKRRHNLLGHKITHTDEKNHQCDVCCKLFKRKQHLLRHKETHTDEKNHKCDICSKLFRTKHCLVSHKRIHRDGENQVKSYQCFECGKNYRCRKGIIKHLQQHKKFSFKCVKCKKVFISAAQFKNHYKVHIEENLFSCSLCVESFVDKRKLKSHVFIKHIHDDSERVVSLQPCNISVSLCEVKSECCKESDMKSCNVVFERLQIENSVGYDVKAINRSEPMDDVAPIEVKVELTDSSESKPFNVSIIYNEESKPFNPAIIYNEEDVKDTISLTNGCIISSAFDEVKQEDHIVKLENYDDVDSVCEEKLGVFG